MGMDSIYTLHGMRELQLHNKMTDYNLPYVTWLLSLLVYAKVIADDGSKQSYTRKLSLISNDVPYIIFESFCL